MINIAITEAALHYIQKKILAENGVAFRLSIKKTGCSGYAYLPKIVNEIDTRDEIIEINGLKVYVDAAWLSVLNGVQIDYIEEDKSGLKQKKLVFINPNELNRCGCGESFHVEQ